MSDMWDAMASLRHVQQQQNASLQSVERLVEQHREWQRLVAKLVAKESSYRGALPRGALPRHGKLLVEVAEK
eukprot:symbB.v1.2.027302.t1/scaffold2790.1/size70228/7